MAALGGVAACGDDPVTPDPGTPTAVGITGTWSGQILVEGSPFCPVTQSVTEDMAGAVTGTGTLDPLCRVASFTLAGTNNTDGVADSTDVTWTSGVSVIVLSGVFDGTDTMTGEVIGGGCAPGQCRYTLTRTDVVLTIRRNVVGNR